MENRIIFREMLTEIKAAANAGGGRVTKQQVRDLLGSLPLEEEHYQLVYNYLEEQNIQVPDSQDELAGEIEPEGEESLSIYVKELLQIERRMSIDEKALMHRILAGDARACEQLIELYLPVIGALAAEYSESNLPVEDLIQEGNLGLLTALSEMEGLESPAACRAHIMNSINKAIKKAIFESKQSHQMNEGIVSRVNHLNEAVKNLEEELEHKVSAEELSAYLGMPLEEIRDILRMSGNQIELEP